MKTRAVVVILALFVVQQVKAQSMGEGLYLNISYFGILGTHPGIKFGVQSPLKTFNKKESGRDFHRIIGAANGIVYFHRRNQLGFGLNLEVGYRHQQVRKANQEIMIGLGYLRTVIPNRIYDFGGGDESTIRSFTGRGHMIKSLALGLGKNTGHNGGADFWMIKPTLFHLKPYNTGTTLNFAIDAGYYFK